MGLGWAAYKARAGRPRRPSVEFRVVLRIVSTILAITGAILLIGGLALQIARTAR